MEINAPGTIILSVYGHGGREADSQTIFPGIIGQNPALANLLNPEELSKMTIVLNADRNELTVTSESIEICKALYGLKDACIPIKVFLVKKKGLTHSATLKVKKARFISKLMNDTADAQVASKTYLKIEAWISSATMSAVILNDETTESAKKALNTLLTPMGFSVLKINRKKADFGMASTEATVTLIQNGNQNPDLSVHDFKVLKAFKADGTGNSTQVLKLKFDKTSLAKIKFYCNSCMVFFAGSCHCIKHDTGNANRGGSRPARQGYDNVPKELRDTPGGHFAALQAAAAASSAKATPGSSTDKRPRDEGEDVDAGL